MLQLEKGDPRMTSGDSYQEDISGASNLAFAVKLAINLLIVGLGILLCACGPWILYPLGMLVTGVGFAHGYELLHQVSHGTAFTNATVSRLVGTLLGLPYGVSVSAYEILHTIHHEEIGTENNLEFNAYNQTVGQSWARRAAAFMMLPHYATVLRRFFRLVKGRPVLDEVHEATQREVRQEYALLLILAFVATLTALLVPGAGIIILKCWLAPLVLVAAPLHSLIELPEHYAVDNQSRDITSNTRTVRTHWLISFLTNWNGFHVEHHWYALVRPEALHHVHDRIRNKITYLNPSYRDFFSKVVFGKRSFGGTTHEQR